MLYEGHDMVQKLLDGILYRLPLCMDLQRRMERWLKWCTDTCEISYLTFAGLGIEAFYITLLT